MKQGQLVAIVVLFVSLMATQQLIAIHPLTHTYSICPDSLYQIRKAAGRIDSEPSDELIYQYWTESSQPMRDETPDPGDLQRDRAYTDSFGLEGRTIRTYIAILNFYRDSDFYAAELDWVRDYLYTFPWDIYQNALEYRYFYSSNNLPNVPDDWDDEEYCEDPYEDQAWWELTAYQRARELGYNR